MTYTVQVRTVLMATVATLPAQPQVLAVLVENSAACREKKTNTEDCLFYGLHQMLYTLII